MELSEKEKIKLEKNASKYNNDNNSKLLIASTARKTIRYIDRKCFSKINLLEIINFFNSFK